MLPPDQPASADKEHGYDRVSCECKLGIIFRLCAVHRDRNNISVIAVRSRDLLLLPDLTDALDQIPAAGSLLEVHFLRSAHHPFCKAVDLRLIFPLQELEHPLYSLTIGLLVDISLTRGKTLSDMIVKAGPVLPGFLREPLAAGTDHVELPQELDRIPDRSRIRIRAKILRTVLFHRSCDEDSGIHLVRCDTDVRIIFIILQHRVVFRAVLLDQVGFQHQRLKLRVRNDILKPIHFRDHPLDLGALFIPFLEVLTDPVLQNDSLSDVDDRVMLVVHDINAGLVRQFFQFFLYDKVSAPVHFVESFPGETVLVLIHFVEGFLSGIVFPLVHIAEGLLLSL